MPKRPNLVVYLMQKALAESTCLERVVLEWNANQNDWLSRKYALGWTDQVDGLQGYINALAVSP